MRRRLIAGCIACVIVAAVEFVGAPPRDASPRIEETALTSGPPATDSADPTSDAMGTSTVTTTIGSVEAHIAATRAVISGRRGETSFSLIDLASGQRVDEPTSQSGLRSASIIKVAIAVAALRRDPSPSEQRLALLTSMIERSDNDAASELYDDIGGPRSMQTLVDDLGMTDTVASSVWGFTTTTAHDLATLFGAVASGHALDAKSTDLLLSLMSHVTASQAWGIKDAVPDNVPIALKNGWYADNDAPVARVNCGAIVGDPASGVVLTITTRYPQSLGVPYGQKTCRLVAAAILPA